MIHSIKNTYSISMNNIFFSYLCSMDKNEFHSFRLPAEWEQQDGIMLIWPHEDTDWRPYLEEITEVYLQMADAITRHEELRSLLVTTMTRGLVMLHPSPSCLVGSQRITSIQDTYLIFVSMDGERSLQQRKITESTDRFTRPDYSMEHWKIIKILFLKVVPLRVMVTKHFSQPQAA